MLKVGEPSLRARGVCSREILVLIEEARCAIMEPSLRTARPSRTTLLLIMEARCTIIIMVEPSLRTARPSRATLLMVMEARCTMMVIMEPALELTACAKEIPHKTFMWFLEIAISVLTVRDYNIFIGEFGLFRDELGGGGDPADTSRSPFFFSFDRVRCYQNTHDRGKIETRILYIFRIMSRKIR